MSLSEKQIMDLRSKYNVGQDVPSAVTTDTRANDRIKQWEDYAAGKTINTEPDTFQTQVEQNEQQESESFLDKAAQLSERTFGKAAKLLYGSTAKTVGTLGLGALASRSKLKGKEKVLSADVEKLEELKVKPVDIAFTILELLPGGGLLAKALKKLPGGKTIAKGISDTVGKLASKQKEKAVKLFTEALAPTTKKTKAQAQKAVPGLLEKGVRGSLPKIQKEAKEKLLEKGEKIDEIIGALPEDSKLKIKPIIDSVGKWQQKFVVDGKVINKKALKLGDDLKDVFVQFGDEVDTKNMRKIRQILDKEVELGRGFTSDIITKLDTQVKKSITDTIRTEIAKEVPKLAKVNKEYSFWKNVDDVVGATIERTKGQSGILRERIGTGIGAVAGVSGGVQTAIIGATAGKILTKAFNSPTWKTLSAVSRNKIADAIVEGKLDKLYTLLRKTGVITKNEIDEFTQ